MKGELMIVIGKSNGKDTGFDLDALLRTRLLIQANSGGGKSFTIRRLVEQAFGKVQIIIIDPEGEFITLREKYGFALLGKGGEITGDVRHAGYIAEKMLEFNASVVCDLYEMKPHERPAWVKAFLTGLLNAPKHLWHPVIVVVDEAHKFCPERGKGEAESTEAMLSLATTGRKRGFCAVLATQRLGKLNKDAAAELLNVLVGRTFLDVDRDRAAEILGVQRAGKAEFDKTIRELEPGQFYALGPAISTTPELVNIGKVQTSHPESGIGQVSAKQPPTPEQVKSLLPKLADLPKGAEEKAKTESELRSQIRSLTAQLSARPKPEADAETIARAVASAKRELEGQLRQAQAVAEKFKERLLFVAGKAAEAAGAPVPEVRQAIPVKENGSIPFMPSYTMRTQSSVVIRDQSEEGQRMRPGARRMLAACAQWHPKAISESQVAAQAGVKRTGGSFSSYKSNLVTAGLIQVNNGMFSATDAGLEYIGHDYGDAPQSTEDVLAIWKPKLRPGAVRMLDVLIEHGGDQMTAENLSELSGVSASGGSFSSYLSNLSTADLIVKPGRGMIAANRETLFL